MLSIFLIVGLVFAFVAPGIFIGALIAGNASENERTEEEKKTDEIMCAWYFLNK